MPAPVRALTFDVFGTVVDWRGSIIREGEAFAATHGLHLDWSRFADRWRAGYAPALNLVRSGQLPWTKLDHLHRRILDSLLDEFAITHLSEPAKQHLNLVWHRLDPWPDAVAGLTRLRQHFLIATLSNGNVSLLVNLSKRAALPWDMILSAEFARTYKPDPEVYLTAARLLDLPPHDILMVAAHPDDLRAAAAAGFRTAFVARPLEFGPARPDTLSPAPGFDFYATGFLDLAQQLT